MTATGHPRHGKGKHRPFVSHFKRFRVPFHALPPPLQPLISPRLVGA